MYKLILVLLSICLRLDASKVYKLHDYEAYYWRDYDGIIPPDAYMVGKHIENEPIYIVQVLHKTLLIPGRLDHTLKNAVYEYATTAWSTNKNIKIFCTNFPHLFEWYETNATGFLNDKNYVIGGYEPQYTVYIGKGVEGQDLLIGKVVYDNSKSIYLHTTHQERSLRLSNYEILSFTPLYVNDFTISNLKSTPSTPTDLLYYNNVYYWRDFRGTIPFDAFSAGVDTDGEIIYIVQVLHKELLIPGMLDKDKKRAVFEYGTKQLHSSENFKILCTNHPELLKWQKTDSCRFPKNDRNIIGGYEPNYSVFIGRGNNNDQLLVGKVVLDSSDLPLLHTTQNGQSLRLKFYEILVCSLPNDNASDQLPTNITTAEPVDTTAATVEVVSKPKSKNTLTTHNTPSRTVLITSDFDLHNVLAENTKSEVSKQEVVEPYLNDNIETSINNAFKNESDGCKCGQRVYIINFN
ncbi:hypothetical protein RN001_013194 [Aquatica leii]|uniref:Uncharacterized protein n=1 Tax=Aquatica leii TaxID=1421715 RepID=A0AAN7NZR5_9COLE|nr:hypothetical protein RN001_013194 [Aquatica leii]